ncbi:VUT family protein [Pseudovibrio sp. SPO723]|uniref:VUT family protein n=1 Tax=Nesiotobacter zosterae TaxID=392721 RepID=UPI0029C5B12B|nr:VUT family protein [Pseudovibrio sp. SPO723]MDX5593386.1 VUT family protein [Pseudovibrio sp. SPO723]
MTPNQISRQRLEGLFFLALFAACIPTSNWMLANVGTVCPSNGPCLIPVGFGLMAPSGVVVVGAALLLRDLVQRRLGLNWAIVAIAVGALLSWMVAPPALVIASVVAFLLSEFADLAIFTPLQRRGLVRAVVLSSLVGLVLDSVIFLQLAFGNLDFLLEQIVGKAWVVFANIPLVALIRRYDARRGLQPA